jgi:hypothetical protein
MILNLLKKNHYIIFMITIVLFMSGCGSDGNSGTIGEHGDNIDETDENITSASPPVLSIEASYNTPGQVKAVVKEGIYLYAAAGSAGLQILKLTRHGNLSKFSSFPIQEDGDAYSLSKKGNYIFMAARSEGIYVIEISVPSEPLLVTKIETPGEASFLVIDQNILYVATTTHLVLADISEPAVPRLLGQAETGSPNQSLAVDNQLVYIAAFKDLLRIIDVADPAAPVLISETRVGFNAKTIKKEGDYVFIGAGDGVFLIFSVIHPADPEFVHALSLKEETDPPVTYPHPLDMIRWGDFLFVADGDSGLKILDISEPSSPFKVDSVNTSGKCSGLFVDGKTIAVANDNEGIMLLSIFETTDRDGDGIMDGADDFPDDPLEWMDTDKDGIGDYADTDDDGDNVSDESDVFPLDISEWTDTDDDGVGDNSDIFPSDGTEWSDYDMDGIGDNADAYNSLVLTPLARYDTSGQVRGVLKEKNIVYAADGSEGMTVLEISEDGSLSEKSTYLLSNGGRVRTLAKADIYLYMACRSEGLLVLDVSDPGRPALVYTYDTPVNATFLTLDNETLYLSDQHSLMIFDVSVPYEPVLLGQLDAATEFEHCTVSDGIAYIAGYYSGLVIADVSDPANPAIMKTQNAGFPLWAIAKRDHYVFTGGERSGLLVYDVSNPNAPELITTLELPDESDPKPADQPPFHMAVYGNYLFVADGYSGIQVADISDPVSPFIETVFEASGYTWDFYIHGNTLIVGDYREGVHLINIGENLDIDGDGIPNYLDEFPRDSLRW